MNKFYFVLSCISLLTACNKQSDATLKDLTSSMNIYLGKRGDLCLAKNVWPIDVMPHEGSTGGRNALQMPVLEKVGLVKSSEVLSDVKDSESGTVTAVKVTRYELTDAGKKYYLIRETSNSTSDSSAGNHGKASQGDFCAAKLSLDKIVGFEARKTTEGREETVVTYTYKIDAAPWTQDADIQKVFPMVARIVRGAGVEQLKESFRMSDKGWVALDL